MPAQHEEHVCFRLLSDSTPSQSSRIFIVLLHQLACRGSLRDLERVLKKFALRPSERLLVVLGVVSTCPKSVRKGAARAAARHVVIYHSVDRPIAAAAHALADIDLRLDDFVIVLRDVLPDPEFVDRAVEAVATSPSVDLFTLTPPLAVGFAASARLLNLFCEECQVHAKHEDGDMTLECFCVGHSGRQESLRALVHLETGRYLVSPLRSYIPQVESWVVEGAVERSRVSASSPATLA